MRALRLCLRWGAVVLLLWLARDPVTPWLLAVREHAVAGIVAASLAGIALAWRGRAAGRIGRAEAAALIAACSAGAVLAAGNAVAFHAQRDAVRAADATTRRLGQHFIVGYRDFDEVAVLAARGLIGGIYVSRRNVRRRGLAEVRAEIDALQALRARVGLPPLVVAADQEGGIVAHMTPPLSALPSLATLVAEADAAGRDADALAGLARAYGERQGRELAAIGVNLNFGPVVDLRPAGRGPRFDTHTLLARRAIAADPHVVAHVAGAYGDGLAAHGVAATLKHFPGLGGVDVDTHHFAARLDTPAAVLAARDWLPFRAAARPAGAIMLGHVVLPGIDPHKPASLSPAVARDLLRGKWQYQGLLVTDDINMGAVFRRGPCRTAVEALQAGVDLVLVAYDPDQYFRAMHCAAAAAREGRLDPAHPAATRRRIAAVVGLAPPGLKTIAAR